MITASITIVTIRPHTNGIERGALGDGRRHRNQERDAGGKIGDARWMRATAATSSELLCHLQQRQGWRAVAHQLRIQLYLPHHLERPPHCSNIQRSSLPKAPPPRLIKRTTLDAPRWAFCTAAHSVDRKLALDVVRELARR